MIRFNKDRGFTLIEVLLVVVILGILAAIAIPAYTGYMRNAKRTEAKTNIQSLRLLLEQYFSENARYCPAADAPCTNKTYSYKENNDGTVSTDTITTFLTGFKPKSAASTTAVLYDYSIVVTGITYTVTAAPVTGRGAPAGNLTIDQDGAKTGW
ncbi:MAG TPA: prepilin-type N-terminal cleavage/methylation domain-containing protein [Nitrospirae bacterium]|nr:prepilin-type N-terminal cleavage/methylation domain-containing protein [Nitrospirota bacterium]